MGKGSSQTTTSVPQYQEDMGRQAGDLAQRIAEIGYVPYYGPDVAAFAPQQMAAFQNTNDMASAFGMGGGAVNMPQAQNYNGIMAYSGAPIMDAAKAELQRRSPEQYAALQPGAYAPAPVQQSGKRGKGGNMGQPAQILTGPDGQEYSMTPVQQGGRK